MLADEVLLLLLLAEVDVLRGFGSGLRSIRLTCRQSHDQR